MLQALGLSLEQTGLEPIPGLLADRPLAAVAGATAEVDWVEQTGFIHELATELGGAPLFLRRSLTAISGLRKLSLKDIFWIGRTPNPVHPHLAGGVLAAVNRQKKKPNDCGSKGLLAETRWPARRKDFSTARRIRDLNRGHQPVVGRGARAVRRQNPSVF